MEFNYKFPGSVLILLSTYLLGSALFHAKVKEAETLSSFRDMLFFMRQKLQYERLAIPELCSEAGTHACESIRLFWVQFIELIQTDASPSVDGCMQLALSALPDLPDSVKDCFHSLGRSLGKLDLQGQLNAMDYTMELCDKKLKNLEQNNMFQGKIYHTLSICFGIFLIIFLL